MHSNELTNTGDIPKSVIFKIVILGNTFKKNVFKKLRLFHALKGFSGPVCSDQTLLGYNVQKGGNFR